jgi:hypothetical protein
MEQHETRDSWKHETRGAAMERSETCYFCERSELPGALAVWLVHEHRRPVHTECWISAYRAGRLPRLLLQHLVGAQQQ